MDLKYDIFVYEFLENSVLLGFKARYLCEDGQLIEAFANSKDNAIKNLFVKIDEYKSLFSKVEKLTVMVNLKNELYYKEFDQ